MAATDNSLNIYVVTSSKGGIGKSTVSANLADALSRKGRRVLCVDCDYSNRSLDLIFGCDGTGVHNIEELVCGSASPEDSVIEVRDNSLWFVPGPLTPVTFAAADFERAVKETATHFECDTVIIDTPGASDGLLPVVATATDKAIIVASHMPTAIRGADHTGLKLAELGISERFLIINRFEPDKVIKGEHQGINELIDSTHLRLLGVVPDSGVLEQAQENGILAADIKKKDKRRSREAFDEIAARMCGERVPILSFYNRFRRKKLIDPTRKKKKNP